jgi:hypothetical protein
VAEYPSSTAKPAATSTMMMIADVGMLLLVVPFEFVDRIESTDGILALGGMIMLMRNDSFLEFEVEPEG